MVIAHVISKSENLGKKLINWSLILSADLFFREHQKLTTKIDKSQFASERRPFFFREQHDFGRKIRKKEIDSKSRLFFRDHYDFPRKIAKCDIKTLFCFWRTPIFENSCLGPLILNTTTNWGHTKFYFLKRGRRTKKFKKPWPRQPPHIKQRSKCNHITF